MAQAGICSRTAEVRDAIVAKVPGKTGCAAITDTDLAGIDGAMALNGKFISVLKAGDFDGLTGLGELKLHYNSLSSLPAGVFDELSGLSKLNLYGNRLTGLPAGVFDRLTGLTNLNLGGNSLSSLPAGVFDELSSLQVLGLHENRSLVAGSLAGAFDRLTSLTHLRLSFSGLASVPAGVFDKLTSLTYLNLAANKLSSLPAGVFDKLTGLTFLDLNGNSLTGLRAGVFDRLTGLENLVMTGNNLTGLPAGVFDELTGLKVLWLSNNRLGSLDTDVFAKLSSLVHLNLDRNKLSNLHEDVFAKLSSLIYLWLHDNELSTLPSGVFARLSRLGNLNLSGNSGLGCLPVIPGRVWTLTLDKKSSAYAACGAAVRVKPTCLAVAAGATATYTVALGAAPNRYANGGNVTVTPASSASGTATVLPAKLTFTTSSWATAQTVTVTGQAAGQATIVHTVSGGGYDSAAASGVAVPVGLVLPPAPTRPAAAARNASVRLSDASIVHNCGPSAIVKWQYRYKSKPPGGSWGEYGSWADVTGTSNTMPATTVTGLTNGTEYRFKVRAVNDRGGGAESDESDAVTPAPAALTASGVTATTAKLAIANWSEAWSFKGDYVSCTNVAAGTSEVSLSGLTPGRDYLVFAYGAHDCPVNDDTWPRPLSIIFTTLLRKVTGVSVTAGVGSLTVGWTAQSHRFGYTGYHVQWKSGTGDWSSDRQSDVATNSATISGLTGGVAHTVRIRSYHRGYLDRIKYGEWSDEATGKPVAPAQPPPTPSASTLTSSAVEATTATLTIGNHAGGWHYRYTSPDGGACSPQVAAGTATANLTGLSPATSYAFAAYGDSACSTELATAPAFLTKPGQVTGLALAPWPARLDVSWKALAGEVAGYKVQWKSGNRSYDAARQNDVRSGTGSAIAGLTDGTAYTVRVAAYNATGAGAWSAEATGTPGAELHARLARVNRALVPEAARTILSSSSEALSERIRRRLSGEAVPPPRQALRAFVESRGQGLSDGTLALREALGGASISLPLAAAGDGELRGSGAGLWASGDWRRLSGGGRTLAWDGGLAALHLGADARLGGGLLAGLALSVSEASFDYVDRAGEVPVTGDYTVRMMGLHPYAARSWADGSGMWASAGYASGGVEIEDGEAGRRQAGSRMASLSAGGTLRLTQAGEPALALKGEAFAGRLGIKDGGDLAKAADAAVSRLRAALAGEAPLEVGPGASLTPSAELGLRWDGGDGETGAGVELGAGLAWTVPSQGLTLDARGRTLLAHERARDEWGAGGGLRLAPDPRGRGPSFGLRLSLGHAESGLARLWDEGAGGGEDGPGERPPARLDTEIGYGVAASGLPGGLLAPYAGLGLEDGGGRRYRLGFRMARGAPFAVSLEGVRSESAGGGPVHAAMLRLDMKW